MTIAIRDGEFEIATDIKLFIYKYNNHRTSSVSIFTYKYHFCHTSECWYFSI